MDKSLASRVIDNMYNNDPYSIWLGIERVQEAPGHVVLKMVVRAEMLNGFGIAHGGITYALADSALAFAANSHGVQSVSIETSISHTKPVKEGDTIIATAEEMHLSKSTGIYQVKLCKLDGTVVALFKGTVFRTGKEWFPNENI